MAGDEQARTFVYLHGLGCAGSSDCPQIASHALLRAERAVIVDLLGHGYSDRPRDFSYGLHDHAATVAEVIEHLGLESVVLVGHSMGGSVATVLASERPDLVGQLVVAEPNWHAGGGMFSKPIAEFEEEDYVSPGFAALLAGYDETYAARVRVADPRAVHRSAVGLIAATQPDMAARFLALDMPRTLVVGDRSRPYEDEGIMAGAGIPVLEVPDAGHDMMHDNPDGFARVLAKAASWFRTHRRRSSGVGDFDPLRLGSVAEVLHPREFRAW